MTDDSTLSQQMFVWASFWPILSDAGYSWLLKSVEKIHEIREEMQDQLLRRRISKHTSVVSIARVTLSCVDGIVCARDASAARKPPTVIARGVELATVLQETRE